MSERSLRTDTVALAPWVQHVLDDDGNTIMLGPRSTVSIGASFDTLTSKQISAISEIASPEEFTVSPRRPVIDYIEAYFAMSRNSCATPAAPDVLLTAPPEERHLAFALSAALTKVGMTAEIQDPDGDTSDMPGSYGNIPLVHLSYKEPVHEPDWLNRAIEQRPVVWIGSTSDGGLHVGPIIDSAQAWADYHDASWSWAEEIHKTELGFTHRPISHRTDPENMQRLGKALKLLLEDGARNVVYEVRSHERRILWTELRHRQVLEGEIASLSWERGLIRRFRVKNTSGSVVIASCLTPCGGVAGLEGNSGKNTSEKQAIEGAVGESIERYAAWQTPAYSEYGSDSETISIHALHPHGPIYNAKKQEPIELISGQSLVDEAPLRVPASLVLFPYTPGAPYRKPTYGHTTGLASHRSLEAALVRAACEIVERDSFYDGFLNMRVGELVARVEGNDGFELLSVVYGGEPIPVVHTFALSHGSGIAARGSGSGCSMGEAVERSQDEACQVFTQVSHGAPRNEADQAYEEWHSRTVVTALLDYLSDFRSSRRPILPGRTMEETDLLDRIICRARSEGRKFGFTELRSPIRDRRAVRAFMTEAICHQWASDSAAGKRIMNAKWRFGIPM
ncbi:YcaO-like family protein [Nocardiopsis kunsanensis]|nr:YcaO-like family protein [Nocardiopsis kunsanensis]